MKHLRLFEENSKHCAVVEKFMKYFKSKSMNKLAWWIDRFHLPLINECRCESISYEDGMYSFSPTFSSVPYIRGIPKDHVPSAIRSIMDLASCDYIDFSTSDHNYGYLLTYNTKGMRYTKSLDPDDIDEDEFAQKILETLIDQKFITDEDEDKRVDYELTYKSAEEGEKYNL